MKELLAPSMSDIHFKVGDEVFLCHKEVLRSRCEYFAAMLRHDWAEASSKEVILEHVEPAEIACLLCFLYGGSIEMPEFCPLNVVAQVADMYCISQLADAVKLHAATELCHSFHKPCKVCADNFAEALQICSIFGKGKTLSAILKWNSAYFCTLWHTNGFYTLPSSLRKRCLSAVKRSIHVSNVIDMVIKVDRLLSSITRVKWTMPAVANASELMNYCCSFIVSAMWSLVENKTIIKLFEGMGFKSDIVDRILMEIVDGITIYNACDIYLSADRLHYLSIAESWDQRTVKLLIDLKKKVWSFLVSNHFAVIHTYSWDNLNSYDRKAITSQSLCGGDANRKLSKKPVLSSSLNIKPPKPAVLVRIPMKVKLRKASRYPRTNDATVSESSGDPDLDHESSLEVTSQPGENQAFEIKEAPERQSIITMEEFIPGAPIEEVSDTSYYEPMSPD